MRCSGPTCCGGARIDALQPRARKRPGFRKSSIPYAISQRIDERAATGDVIDFSMNYSALPGGDLVLIGLRDLECGVESEEALLVSIGEPRLRHLGVGVTIVIDNPEHRLYALLAVVDTDSAHSRYNALIRRLVSFERAAECVRP